MYGRLTAREFYAWFVVPDRKRREQFEAARAGSGTDATSSFVQPGDKELPDPPMTEEGTLLFLSALGVQGVPRPGERNGDGRGAGEVPG